MQKGVRVLSFYYSPEQDIALCNNGQYTVGKFIYRNNVRGDHDFEYLLSIKRDGKQQYPINRVECNGVIYELGDIVSLIDDNKAYGKIIDIFVNQIRDVYVLINPTGQFNILNVKKELPVILNSINIHGETYCISDYTIYNNEKMEIVSIETISNNTLVSLQNPKYPGSIEKILAENIGPLITNPLTPEPPRSFEINPLFVTEDGANIFEGDSYFVKNKENIIQRYIGDSNNNIDGIKCFSTEEALSEYYIINTPILSYQDIIDLEITKSSIKLDSIKLFIRQKLNG